MSAIVDSLSPAVHHVVREPPPRRVCHRQNHRSQPRVGAGQQDACREGAELRGHQKGVLVPDAVEPSAIHLLQRHVSISFVGSLVRSFNR